MGKSYYAPPSTTRLLGVKRSIVAGEGTRPLSNGMVSELKYVAGNATNAVRRALGIQKNQMVFMEKQDC